MFLWRQFVSDGSVLPGWRIRVIDYIGLGFLLLVPEELWRHPKLWYSWSGALAVGVICLWLGDAVPIARMRILGWFQAPKALAAALAENADLKNQLAELLAPKTGPLTTAHPPETIHTISFDYLPISPLEKEWKQVYNQDGEAEFGSDPEIPGSLRIKIIKSEVAIHHDLPPHATRADHLEFTAKYTTTTMIFTRLSVSTRDGSVQRQVDIKYKFGDLHAVPTNPVPGHDENKMLPEQTLSWPAECLSGGRLAFNIDLRKAAEVSLGSQGWVFKSFTGIRLRSNLSISPIVLGKAKSETS